MSRISTRRTMLALAQDLSRCRSASPARRRRRCRGPSPRGSARRAICCASFSASTRVSSSTRSISRCESERKISQPNSAMSSRTKSPKTSGGDQQAARRGGGRRRVPCRSKDSTGLRELGLLFPAPRRVRSPRPPMLGHHDRSARPWLLASPCWRSCSLAGCRQAPERASRPGQPPASRDAAARRHRGDRLDRRARRGQRV